MNKGKILWEEIIMQRVAMVTTRRGFKFIIVGIVLILFFGYLQLRSYNTVHFKINKTAFSSVANYEAYINKQSGMIPGLALAHSFHLLTKPDQSVPITEWQRKLQINDLWVTNHSLYMTYSLNINKTDTGPSDIPKLLFSKVIYHFKDGKSQQVTVQADPKYEGITGHAVGYRFYNSIYFNAHLPYNESTQHAIKKSVLSSITLIQPTLKVYGKQEQYTLQPMTLKAKLTSENQVLEKVAVNQSIPIGSKASVHINDIQLHNNGTKIDLTINQPPKNKIQEVLFDVSSPNGHYGQIGAYFQGDHQEIMMQPIKALPSVITLQAIKYMYRPNDQFDLNGSLLIKGHKLNKQMKIGTIKGADVYADVTPLKINKQSPSQVLITVRIKLNRSVSGKTQTNFASAIHLEAQHHQQIPSLKVYDWKQNANEEKMIFSVSKDDYTELKELHILIKPIYYLQTIANAKPITINLQ